MQASRLFAQSFVLALLAGCPDRTISALPPVQDKIEVKDIPVKEKRVDILFVIDDSPSMEDEQASLRANFDRFIAVLESLEGGLPDVHIGVITPNLGTSALDGSTFPENIGTCSGRGEGGRLRTSSTGAAFIVDEDDGAGGRRRNYTGTLTEAFAEIATVGSGGCGIEQHLEATKRALDGSNPGNAGFLRPDAALAVIFLADEDDCSLLKSTIFDAPPNAAYGDIVNFRCTSQGVECETGDPDLNVTGQRDGCTAREDSELIAGIERYVEFFATLKPDQRDLGIAGIVASPERFVTTTGSNGVTVVDDACDNAQIASPAVRTSELVSRFDNNTLASICEGDLSGGLTQVGALVKRIAGDPCFQSTLLDVDPQAPGPQYDCSVVEYRRADGVDQDLRIIGQCGSGTTPCWHVEEDAERCGYTMTDPHLKLVIDWGDEVPAPDSNIRVNCVTTGTSGGPVL